MTEGTDKVWAHPILWVVTITAISLNIAAAMAHSPKLLFIGLSFTGFAASAAIGSGMMAGLMRLRRQL